MDSIPRLSLRERVQNIHFQGKLERVVSEAQKFSEVVYKVQKLADFVKERLDGPILNSVHSAGFDGLSSVSVLVLDLDEPLKSEVFKPWEDALKNRYELLSHEEKGNINNDHFALDLSERHGDVIDRLSQAEKQFLIELHYGWPFKERNGFSDTKVDYVAMSRSEIHAEALNEVLNKLCKFIESRGLRSRTEISRVVEYLESCREEEKPKINFPTKVYAEVPSEWFDTNKKLE